MRLFPPRRIKLKVKGVECELLNPGNYHYTDYLLLDPGKWEKDELNLFITLARRAAVIFDVGANMGVYSLLAAKANPSASVLAFEPYQTNLRLLSENVQLNGCTNVTCVGAALGDKHKQIELFVPSNDRQNTSVASTNEAFTNVLREFDGLRRVEVEQLTMDDFVRTRGLERVDLIKLDVEYYEINVLKGGKETIREFGPAVLCEVTIYEVLTGTFPELAGMIDPELASQIEEFFQELDYSFYVVGRNGILRTDTVFSHPENRNFLFSRYRSGPRYIPYSDEGSIMRLLPPSGPETIKPGGLPRAGAALISK